MSKTKKVTLENADLGKVEYDVSHAQRLVALEAKRGLQLWKPTKGSNYEIIDGSLKLRTSTGTNQEA